MTDFTTELIAKAKAAKSAEELLELARENEVELTAEEAKICFEQLHTNAAISDDDLEAVSGGGCICEFFEDFFQAKRKLNESSRPNCSDILDTPNIPNISNAANVPNVPNVTNLTNVTNAPNVTNLPFKSDSPTSDNSITTLPYNSNDKKNKIVFL